MIIFYLWIPDQVGNDMKIISNYIYATNQIHLAQRHVRSMG